jgi:hypothetical protein
MQTTSSNVGWYVGKELLNINMENDGTDFHREGDEGKGIRHYHRVERGTDPFEQQLDKQGLPAEKRADILTLHHLLQEVVSLKKKTNIPEGLSQKGEVEKIIDDHLKTLGSVDSLGKTASAFDIYHERFNKARTIPDFKTLWAAKVEEYFETLALTQTEELKPLKIFKECLDLYTEGLKLYVDINEKIVPGLIELGDLVNKRLFGEGVWFSGRDGIPLYLSVKAHYFGKPLGNREAFASILRPQIDNDPKRQEALIRLACEKQNVDMATITTPDEREKMLNKGIDIYFQTQARLYDILKYAFISRLMIENAKTKADKQRVRQLLVKIGIHPDMVAADTGHGSVITDAMRMFTGYNGSLPRSKIILWDEGSDINRHYNVIEVLPHKTDRALTIDDEGRVIAIPAPLDVQYLNWVADHAIIRHFAPRKPNESVDKPDSL